MDDARRTLDALGERLRRLRQRRELTLSELAERTAISISTLSRLESGARRPTLEQLLPLARAYGVTLDELVDAPETGDPRVHVRPHVHRDGTRTIPLTRRPGGIQAFKMVLPPARCTPPETLLTHEGYEWVYVLSGRLRLMLGERDMVLAPGEAAEFDTRTPHWFGPLEGGTVEVLSLFGKQGERAHTRLAPGREPQGQV
ncbi:XRE family transcriptional regulator [Mycetocola tolaasinivorans]|uniref:XRE family transcriptional regulator n=1 Tax=Mycetocola tolaasinivorans TaxID=76635 RepID=A0A3L7AE56_9MICO|nr:XRE family transcriptional regulator [Mycetocola tolaasinivorans]RLP77988.1 XRE family transcriptional regulator [Mycetocola tolaasinivorans]